MIKKLFCNTSIKLLGLSEKLFWFLLKLNPAALHTWLEIRWFLTRTCSVTCEKILMPWIDQEAFDISANKHIKELNRRRRRTLWTNLIRCVILIFDGLLKNFNFFFLLFDTDYISSGFSIRKFNKCLMIQLHLIFQSSCSKCPNSTNRIFQTKFKIERIFFFWFFMGAKACLQ